MNEKWILLIFVAISILFLVLLAPYTSQPDIFSPKLIQGTEHNLNPDSLKQISSENSVEALSMMQEFIDLSETIIVNVRYKNLDNAKQELEDYKDLLQQYDNLVVNLDMTRSEIEEYRQNNHKEIENLESLVEEMEDLDKLDKLQIQYQDSDDSDIYYSITYNLQELKSNISNTKKELSDITSKKIEYSEKYELRTEELKESAAEIGYIGDIETASGAEIQHTSNFASYADFTQETMIIHEEEEEKEAFQLSPDTIFKTGLFAIIAILSINTGYRYYSRKFRRGKKTDYIPPVKILTDPRGFKSIKTPEFLDLSDLSSGRYKHKDCRMLVKYLFQTIAKKNDLNYRPSMTNREFLSLLPPDEELEQFTRIYEKIVYIDKASDNDINEFFGLYNSIIGRVMESGHE